MDAQRVGLIGSHAFEHLVNDVDARTVRLEEGGAVHPEAGEPDQTPASNLADDSGQDEDAEPEGEDKE